VIRGERVALRTVREADLPALYALINDVSLQGEHMALPLRSEPSFRKDFNETGFLDAQRGRFLVTDLEDRTLGTIVYFSVNYMDGFEIGYHLFDPGARNKGVMGEALRLAVRYLFSRHKINRLQVVTAPENEASKRLALKCGFKLEGTLRGNIFHDGHNSDSLLYSLLRAEAAA
jgi:[ribosomal protein S5]-alanine N-acetyltransferase